MEIVRDIIRGRNVTNVRIIRHSRNRGQSAGRNSGIAEASGEYLYFLDSDDFISEDCIQLLVSMAVENQLDVVFGENYIVDKKGTKHVVLAVPENVIFRKSQIRKLYLQRKLHTVVWNRLVRRELVVSKELFFKEEHIIEDELWSFSLAMEVESMGVVHKPIYTYIIRPNSTMTSAHGIQKRWTEFLFINGEIRKQIRKKRLEKDIETSKYFLTNLLINLNGFTSTKTLNYSRFREIRRLAYFDILKMRKAGCLSLKECIVYLYFNLPVSLGWAYYNVLQLYFRMK
jgi:glycosyltransferase involved in cell wall biosynthesis